MSGTPASAFLPSATSLSSSATTSVDWEAFRTLGKEAVDFVADYYQRLQQQPSTKKEGEGEAPLLAVRSQVEPGYLRSLLPSKVPEKPEELSAVLADVNRAILPGITHWQHPSFFGFFPANSSPPALIGDMLSGMFGCIGFSWIASPALTELESIVLDSLAELLGLPLDVFGSAGKGGSVIQGTASEATLVALLAAKARIMKAEKAKAAAKAMDGGVELQPFDELSVLRRLVLYSTDQAHSSVKKAAMIAGIPESQCRVIATTAATNYAIDPAALEKVMREDAEEKGMIPCFVVLTFGTTSSGACDPLRPSIEAVRRATSSAGGDHRHHPCCWTHVDAAWAGSALVCEEFRSLADGIDLADSLDVNPHKWLKTNFDCSTMWVREREWLVEALSITPEYLRSKQHEAGQVIDFRDLQIPLGRRFRSLKLWMVLRMEGSEALKAFIREHVRLAQDVFAPKLLALKSLSSFGGDHDEEEEPLFELPVPPSLSLVCFRLKVPSSVAPERADKMQELLLSRLNASGKLFLVHTKLAGKGIVLRMAIGGALTKEEHVMKAVADIEEAAKALLEEEKEGLLLPMLA